MSKQKHFNIFQVSDFREFISFWTKEKERGELTRISKYLHMQTTLMSQIRSGHKCFTEEQAYRLCGYFNFNSLETDYFLKLILKERAGTDDLKKYYEKSIHQIKENVLSVKNRVANEIKMSESDLALFYSSWKYAAVRLLTDLSGTQSPDTIAQYLKISRIEVQEILTFLVSKNLVQFKDGIYMRTEMNTYVDSQSPLVVRHHQNWRTKAMVLQEKMKTTDLSFTAPLTLSEKDVPRVKEIILEAISELTKIVKDSKSEKLYYLGIDWLNIIG